MRYRADIDGLRAVAVLAVVFFHAGVPGFSGGFVGVDVFFVISGYLIAQIIVRELDAGSFSLRRFYERRARRILPALLVVVLATLLVGGLLLLPNRYEDLGESALAALAFFANIHFYNDTGYFDVEASLKPLLHTWSLSVEEQYYFAFPLLMKAVARRWRGLLLFGFLLASLAMSAWVLDRDPAGAFFLPHTRVWELLLGALAGSGVLRALASATMRAVLGVLGLAAVLAAVFLYDGATAFPGLAALPPCLGTLLLLLAGGAASGRGSPVSTLLAARPLVGIGRVSYSLYLWHWPILVLLPQAVQGTQTPLDTGLALLLCALLAVLSWRFVEQPFRHAKSPGRPVSLWRLGVLGIAAFAVAIVVTSTSGLPARMPAEARAYIAVKKERHRLGMACMNSGPELDVEACRLGSAGKPPALLLIGDSHAAVLAPEIDTFASASGLGGLAVLESGCPPGLGLRRLEVPIGEDCEVLEQVLRARLEEPSLRAVILHARWPLYVEGERVGEERGPSIVLAGADNLTAMAEGLDRLVGELRTRGLVVVLVGSVPELGSDVPTLLAHRSLLGDRTPFLLPSAEVEARQQRATAMLRDLAARHGAILLEPRERLCATDYCRVLGSGGEMLYFDDDHLSFAGVRTLRPLFAPVAAALAAP